MDSQHDLNAEFKPEIPNENRNDGEERSAHQSGPVKQDSSIQVTTKEPPSSPHIVKNKGRGRRVRFPEDEKIVSERIPPPNPWKDIGDVSTEELVAAYHAACASNQVKPSPIIIQQLQKMTDLSVRVDGFTFQGERVDSKTAESLEEIFRRVQFNLLDIEGCNIEDEAAVALFEMVEFYETAVKISMSSVKGIGMRGWQAASKMIRKSSCLQTIDISRTSWSEHSVPILCRALRADTCLVALHLEACNLAGRPLVLLMSALRMNHNIRELFLADNRLMPSDAFHIGGMLKHNTGLKLLDLRNNNMQDVGVSHISDGLAGQMRGQLNTLVLWNNHVTHVGAGHLGKTLPMITTLETLNMGQNNLGIDGIMKLKEGLMKNKFLQRMGLFSCRINDEGAIALAEYLADNCQLIRLDLRENDIRTGGLMALSRSLKLNKVLLRLDLDKNIKKENLNGHAELQQQFLEDIDRLLYDNRQFLEENHQSPRLSEGNSTNIAVNQASPAHSQTGSPLSPVPNALSDTKGDKESDVIVSNNYVKSSSTPDEANDDDNIASSAGSGDSQTAAESSVFPDTSFSDTPVSSGARSDDGTETESDDTHIGIDDASNVVMDPLSATTDIIIRSDTKNSVISSNSKRVSNQSRVPHSLESSENNPSGEITPSGQNTSSEGSLVSSDNLTEQHQSTFRENDGGLPQEDSTFRTEKNTISPLSSSQGLPEEQQEGNGEDRINGNVAGNSLSRGSPPGIRINDNIKLLTVTNHVLDGKTDLNKGLDLAGQQLMASAIEDSLPTSDAEASLLQDGHDDHLSQSLNILPPPPTLVPLQDTQS